MASKRRLPLDFSSGSDESAVSLLLDTPPPQPWEEQALQRLTFNMGRDEANPSSWSRRVEMITTIRRFGPTSLTEAGPGEADASPKLPESDGRLTLKRRFNKPTTTTHQRTVGDMFNPNSGKELFVIDTSLPIGNLAHYAVAQYSMIDVIARSQRLLGKEVYFPWGVDRNGINIEFTVEKNTKRKMKTYDRQEFLELCKSTIEEFTQAMRQTAKRVGLSCDFDREYLTDAPIIEGRSPFLWTFSRREISLKTFDQTSTTLLRAPPSLTQKWNACRERPNWSM